MHRLELPLLVFSDATSISRVSSAMLKCRELACSIDNIIGASSCSSVEKKKMSMATAMIKLTCVDTIINLFTNNDVSAQKRAILAYYIRESETLLSEVHKLSPDQFMIPTIPIRPGLHICRDIALAKEVLFLLNKIERRVSSSVGSLRNTKSLRRQLKSYYVPVGEIMHLCAGFKVCLFLDHEELIPDSGWRKSTDSHREFNSTANKNKFFP